MPLVRVVLFEKIKKESIVNDVFMYVNGVEVFILHDDFWGSQPNKFGKPKMCGGKEKTAVEKNTLIGIFVFNYPIESVMTDSALLWRVSKFVFRSKAYTDSINNKIVINYL